MKQIIKTLLILTFVGISFVLNAQVEIIIKTSFPEWYGELQITPDKKYDKKQKDAYRKLYQKFDKALSDVAGYRIGVIDKTTIQVLDFDLLKRVAKKDNLDSLENMIRYNQMIINDFLKWDEKFAADSINLPMYYTKFSDNLKNKKLDDAYPYWQAMFNKYPIFHTSIYSGGQQILTYKIDKKDAKRDIYIDSLYILFDQQARAYPNQAVYAKSMKAFFFYKYNIDQQNLDDTIIRKKMVQNYQMFKEVINEGQSKCPAFIYPVALKLSLFLATLNKVDAKKYPVTPDNFLEDYLTFGDYLTQQFEAEKDAAKKDAIKKQGMDPLDIIFTNSEFSTCEKLIAIFTPKFETVKNNATELKKMITLMSKKTCFDAKLYEDCIKALYTLEPSAKAAQNIGQLLSYKGNFTEAARYYDEAIDKETVDSVKARLYFEAAKIYNQLNQYSKAREYCRNSIKLNPNDGKPLILIATMYAATASSVGTNEFEKGAVFWAAADKLIEAKKIDPSVAEDADKLLSQYAARYPKKEEAFMYSVYEGNAYTVGGWIGETTTARFLK